MKIFYIILGAFITFMIIMFLRVGETNKEIHEMVQHTEKIQVVFYHKDAPDTYVEITDRDEIKDFAGYISNEDTPVMKCGYDGRIVFFLYPDALQGNNNSVLVEFNLQEGCLHAAYTFSGALHTKSLSKKGIQYLQSLQN